MPAPWLMAAAWVWLALAAFAACVWGRFRHRLPALVCKRMAGVAGIALLTASALAVWGWWQPAGGEAADALSKLFWQSVAFGVSVLHLAAAACLLGGTIYLAFGRLMGSRACSACGWQAMIVERLPEVAVATAVTSVGILVFQGTIGRGDRALWTGLLELLPWGVVWGLAATNRSVVMVRQPSIARTALVWMVLFPVGWIVWRWSVDVAAGDPVTAGWLTGAGCGVALVVLAAALHRQALILGLRYDRPAALAEIVGGLSPLRRLAACALGGLLLAGLCGGRLFVLHGHDASSAKAGLLIVAVALLWLLVTWGAALVRDRLGAACSPSISAATVTLLVGLGAIRGTIGGRFDPGLSTSGPVIVFVSLALAACGIGSCSLTAWRSSRQTC